MSSLSILSSPEKYRDKEVLYLDLRTKENRVKTIEEIRMLPDVDSNSDHTKEWKWRKRSAEALLKYCSKNKTEINILELGCGTGWLANHLSKIDNTNVYAVDLNLYELEQGHKAFDQDNLHFVYGDIFDDIFPGIQFDYIILAASVQYFPSLPELIDRLKSLLKQDGEIHIIDSYFYNKDAKENAKKRSFEYFDQAGIPGMNDYYFHHSLEELNELGGVQLNKIITNRFDRLVAGCFNFNHYHIFPWFKFNK